jgi:hypothetical protein
MFFNFRLLTLSDSNRIGDEIISSNPIAFRSRLNILIRQQFVEEFLKKWNSPHKNKHS